MQISIARTTFFIFFILAEMTLSAQVFPCDQRAYFTQVTSSNSNASLSNQDIYNIQVNSQLVTDDLGTAITALGYNTLDQYLYGFNNYDKHVYRIFSDGSMQDMGEPLFLNKDLDYFAGFTPPNTNQLVILGRNSDGFDREVWTINLANNPTTAGLTAVTSAVDIRIEDMATDPIFGNVIGYDSKGNRLLFVGYPGGNFTPGNFEEIAGVSNISGIFFDTLGTLYGYGNATDSGGAIFELDKVTGQKIDLTNTSTGSNKADACACPYRVQVTKTVEPAVVLPCSTVEIIYALENTGGAVYGNIDFEEIFPPDFEIIEVNVSGTFGTITSGVGTNIFRREGAFLNIGADTIRLKIRVGANAGTFSGQAKLEGLPAAFGENIKSDNPATSPWKDPTPIEVAGSDILFPKDTLLLCPDAQITLTAPAGGLSYLWNNGSTDQDLILTETGTYFVDITGECGSYSDTVEVIEYLTELEVDLGADLTVPAGSSIDLSFTTNAISSYTSNWESDLPAILSCYSCENPTTLPLNEASSFSVFIADEFGCTATDSVQINIQRSRPVFAPTAFSPNGDDINDNFYLQTAGNPQVLSLTIFDRWGNQVFYTENSITNKASRGWNGIFKGRVAEMGVYVWQAELLYSDGVNQVITGDFLLMR